MATFLKILQENRAKIYFFLCSALFCVLVWYATKTVNYYLFGLPLVVIFAYFSMVNYKWLWYLMIALMPLSITDVEFFGKFGGVTFPTDFLAIILLGLLGFKMLSERGWRIPFNGHPIPIIILLQVIWMVFAAVPSSMPVVSWKAVVASLWMIAGFYLLPVVFFKESKSVFRFFQLIIVSFSIAFVMIMMLYLSTGRNPFGLRFNPGPFLSITRSLEPSPRCGCRFWFCFPLQANSLCASGWLARIGLVMFIMALFFSYSRGAWASCVAALGMLVVVLQGKWARRLLLPAMMLGLLVGTFVWYSNQDTSPSRNKAVSRKNLSEHIASVTNFRTDDSNRERINRWYCAWQMFLDKPAFGYGPGTYGFQYGNFQKSTSRTEVSTNRGDNGTAHNEWLLSLSESGLPGPILLTLLFIVPFYRGLRGYSTASKRNTRLLYLACSFGLLTYDIHAFVNNFLDQDKVGGSYYCLLAIITALDIYYLPKEKGLPQETIRPRRVELLG